MRKTFAALVIVAGLSAGCAPPLPRLAEPLEQEPADFPRELYRAALARGEPVFRVDPARSLVVIEVHRAGSLARVGHDHVVASHDVQGYAAPDQGRSDLYVPLGRLVVDESELRAEAHFDTQPSEADISGTRANMLRRVLEADTYPFALVSVSGVVAGPGDPPVDVAITLHGTTHATRVPLRIENQGDEIAVAGTLVIQQTDFGIAPFSILGGAIQVANEVSLRFRISARRCSPPSC
jgi:hypothetical protein